METINWKGYDWLTQERWGQIHKDKKFMYYDSSAVDIDDQEQLILKTQYNPKYFKELKCFSNVGVGLVSNTTKFEYGYFEIEAKLPKGKQLWPAFWLWSFESWPPEIDVFEGYTKNGLGYFSPSIKNPLGFWNVQTNVHLGETPNNYNIGGKTHWFGFKNPTDNFIKYGCLWEKDKIEIFFGGRMVRKITDQKTLSQFHGKTMNVIINNSVDYGIDKNNPTYSEFVIKSFSYIKS